MDTIKHFLKGTKITSRLLFVLWLLLAIFGDFAEESKVLEILDFAVFFLLPAIVNELCKNPIFKNRKDKFFLFMRYTQIVSRVLFQLWALTTWISLTGGLFVSIVVMSVVFLLPIFVIERKNNPVFNPNRMALIADDIQSTESNNEQMEASCDDTAEQENVELEDKQQPLQNEKRFFRFSTTKEVLPEIPSTKSEKYINKARIIGFVCLGFAAIFSIGLITNNYTHPDGYIMSVALFSILSTVAFIVSINAPKTKEEAEERRKKQKKPLPSQAVGGTVLCIIGGFLSVALLMPVIAITDENFFATAGKEGIAVGIVMGLSGLVLLLIGIFYLQGKFVDSALAKKEQKAYTRRMRPYKGVYLTEDQLHSLENKESLPVVDTPVFLNYGEVAVWYSEATRQETKNRVIGRTGSYSGGTVRIAKGLSIHTGGSSSKPIYGDVSMQFPGEFVITNERIIFLSSQKGFEIKHTNITAATAYKDGFSFQSRNTSYVLLVPRADLATIAFDGVRTGEIPVAGISTSFDDSSDDFDDDNYDEIDPHDISSIDGMEGHDFEYFCADILRKNGFSEVSVTKGSGDQGVDILATKGGIKYAIQCKNYASPLSNTPIQEVNAGKTFYNCHVGVVMTNSTFTPGAKALAQATGVLLWDRAILQEMMKFAD